MGARRIPAAQAAVEILRDEGVDTVFGCPGAALLPLYAAMERTGGIAHLSAGHAEGAAHMADGWARTTGRPGVAAVAAGPGAVRLLSGLYAAQQDAVPLVCVTGRAAPPATAPALPLRHAGYRPPDLVRLAGAVTKRAERIEDPARIPGAFREAFRIAREGRPGPVLIDVPAELAAVEIVCGPAPAAPSAPGAGPALVDGDRSPAPGAVLPLAVPPAPADAAAHWVLTELADVYGARSPVDTYVVSGLPVPCTTGGAAPRHHRVARRSGPPGWEVPTAIGVRTALDSRGARAAEVVVVVDGRDFPLTAGELAAAAQYDVPFVVVLLGEPEDADPLTDPVKLAVAHGCAGRAVRDPAQLRSAVEWARKEAASTRRPVLLEVRSARLAQARGEPPTDPVAAVAYGT
ncbi:thiamine pyrophosphate-binding protein [Streptomyces sp. NPDC056149]|uniref:thiamine pyrophosphate-binding protein n=1 Tax=Streptomyces sp. NPDC056149 TaxID=3345728 RepID=UPI0035DE83EC